MRTRAWLILAVLLAAASAPAADLEVKPAAPAALPQPSHAPAAAPAGKDAAAPRDELHPPQHEATSPADESWWRKLVSEAPQCRAFTDGCRTCDRDFACSGLPIACQPKDWTCADRKP